MVVIGDGWWEGSHVGNGNLYFPHFLRWFMGSNCVSLEVQFCHLFLEIGLFYFEEESYPCLPKYHILFLPSLSRCCSFCLFLLGSHCTRVILPLPFGFSSSVTPAEKSSWRPTTKVVLLPVHSYSTLCGRQLDRLSKARTIDQVQKVTREESPGCLPIGKTGITRTSPPG